MQNNNLDNNFAEDEIDLVKLVKTLINSKKLIILITLASTLLASIYYVQKEETSQSTVTIEIGSYELLSGERNLIEPVSSLIKKLKIDLIYKQLVDDSKLKFIPVEDELMKATYISISSDFNEDLLKETLISTKNRHETMIQKIANSFSSRITVIDNEIKFINNLLASQKVTEETDTLDKIKAIDNEIEFSKNLLASQKVTEELDTLDKIKAIDNEIEFTKNLLASQKVTEELETLDKIKAIDKLIPNLENKINFLLKLIPDEEKNLLLLESDNKLLMLRASSSPTLQQLIFSYNDEILSKRSQIQNLIIEKDNLDSQLKSIAVAGLESKQMFQLRREKQNLDSQLKSIALAGLESKQMFQLRREKNNLEMQFKLVNEQSNSTQSIGAIKTVVVEKNKLVILLGTMLGFILSVSVVIVRQAFLKEPN